VTDTAKPKGVVVADRPVTQAESAPALVFDDVLAARERDRQGVEVIVIGTAADNVMSLIGSTASERAPPVGGHAGLLR
jgi:hypothetical protein